MVAISEFTKFYAYPVRITVKMFLFFMNLFLIISKWFDIVLTQLLLKFSNLSLHSCKNYFKSKYFFSLHKLFEKSSNLLFFLKKFYLECMYLNNRYCALSAYLIFSENHKKQYVIDCFTLSKKETTSALWVYQYCFSHLHNL